MEIISPIHGNFSYEEKEIIIFGKGIPGFESFKKYIIKDFLEDSPFKLLQSIEDGELGFVIISPFEIIKDYEVKISEEIIRKLEINKEEEVLLYAIVSLNSDIEKITANLKGPLVINTNNNMGEQYILDKDIYNIREKIFK